MTTKKETAKPIKKATPKKDPVAEATKALADAKAKAEKAGFTVKITYVRPLEDGSVGETVLPTQEKA